MIDPSKPRIQVSARYLALHVLVSSQSHGGYVEDRLAAVLRRHPNLPRQERALLLELVQGVKRWELRLDFILSRLTHRPWARVQPVVQQILRLGAYQILFLNRIPAYAAVDETVSLARSRRLSDRQVGFINAVLRRLAGGEMPPLPEADQDPVTALSVASAHPPWLVSRWLERYGFEVAKLRLEANNQVPPLTVRVNSLKTSIGELQVRLAREGVISSFCRYSPGGLQLVEVDQSPASLPSYREGLWLFQDEAAQLVPLLLGVRSGQRVLEIGAGRGGKTSHLGELLDNRGLVVAVDYHRRRLYELGRNIRRWGLTCVQAIRADASLPLPLRPGSLDAALLDVPCSSLGTIRRHPEIKTRLREKDLATFPPRQRALLERTAPLLKSGGRLLYVTCTTEPEENEDLVGGFLADHPEYQLIFEPEQLPPSARELLEPPGYFRTFPDGLQMDGFFAALLCRR
uniref:16S rRNA (cytosine(967)-C(5))-methyltransferase n=1 Tax=Desulfobacca acetoxidans TaxID=60893 RepID=A0A7C5ELY8_9BACT